MATRDDAPDNERCCHGAFRRASHSTSILKMRGSIFARNEGRQSFSLPAAVVQFALDLQRTDATMLALSLAGWF